MGVSIDYSFVTNPIPEPALPVYIDPTPADGGTCIVCKAAVPYKIAVYSALCVPCLNAARAESGYTEPWRPPPGPPPAPTKIDDGRRGLAGFFADWDAKKTRTAPSNTATVIPLRTSRSYVKAAVDNEIATLAATRHGSRNDQLNRSSFALGQLIGAGVLDEGGNGRGPDPHRPIHRPRRDRDHRDHRVGHRVRESPTTAGVGR
jgi:hypothetical protein